MEKNYQKLFFTKSKKFKWWKKVFFITFFKLISVVCISRLILTARIYLPGLYWIAQTLSYELNHFFPASAVFDFNFLVFFLFAVLIDLILIVFAYFYIGKKYAFFSLFATFVWLIFSLIFSLQVVNNWEGWDFLDFGIKADGYQRTQDFSFYFVAFIAGVFSGLSDSFLWKQNISAGGLDYIFTYYAIKKRKQISKIPFFIVLFFITCSILVNEASNDQFSFPIFLYLVFSSFIFHQTRNSLINYLYPKYKLVKIFIITKKGRLVRAELKKFYSHGGNILKTTGIYDGQAKEIITTVTSYLEKSLLLEKLTKIDPDIFFIGTPVDFLEGHFMFSDD